jgi:hypothetical protein
MVMCSRGWLANTGWVIGGLVGYVSQLLLPCHSFC